MATKPAARAARTVTVNHRDLTKALMIAKALDGALGGDRLEDHRTETHELVRLLGAFDLRTGRNDPTQRRPKRSAKQSSKRSANRPAKKARARR